MVWVGEPVQRWSGGRKREAVLRLLRGEALEEVSWELRGRWIGWKDGGNSFWRLALPGCGSGAVDWRAGS